MSACPRCRAPRTAANTYPAPYRRDGLDSYCRDCKRALTRDRLRAAYQRDPQTGRERIRAARMRRAMKRMGL